MSLSVNMGRQIALTIQSMTDSATVHRHPIRARVWVRNFSRNSSIQKLKLNIPFRFDYESEHCPGTWLLPCVTTFCKPRHHWQWMTFPLSTTSFSSSEYIIASSSLFVYHDAPDGWNRLKWNIPESFHLSLLEPSSMMISFKRNLNL